MEWFISEPSLCEMKHGAMSLAHHRHDTSCTPDDDDEDLGLARNSSLRRNMMIRPITSKNPSGRIVARLTRASESEMNFHMLEKAQGEKETKKTKSKMSLRNSLKNIFSIKKRYRSGGKSRNSETSTTTASSALASLATATSTSTSNACCSGGAGLGGGATTSSTTISTATATANYRVVYTDGGGTLSSESKGLHLCRTPVICLVVVLLVLAPALQQARQTSIIFVREEEEVEVKVTTLRRPRLLGI